MGGTQGMAGTAITGSSAALVGLVQWLLTLCGLPAMPPEAATGAIVLAAGLIHIIHAAIASRGAPAQPGPKEQA